MHGFDFAQLLVMYYRAYVNDDEDTKAKGRQVVQGRMRQQDRGQKRARHPHHHFR